MGFNVSVEPAWRGCIGGFSVYPSTTARLLCRCLRQPTNECQGRLRLLWLLLSLSVAVFAVFYTRQHLSLSPFELGGVGPAHARTPFVTTGDRAIDDNLDVNIRTNNTEAAPSHPHHYHGHPHHHRDAPTRHTRADGVDTQQHDSEEEDDEHKENEDMDLWRDERETYSAREQIREQLFERVRGRLNELI